MFVELREQLAQTLAAFVTSILTLPLNLILLPNQFARVSREFSEQQVTFWSWIRTQAKARVNKRSDHKETDGIPREIVAE